MSNDENQGAEPTQAANDGPDFNTQRWHVLIGIRPATDPTNPSDMREGLLIQLAGAAESMDAQGRPDKTNEAVHFAQWLDRNKDALVQLWRTEYVQYMNLRKLSERGVPGLRVVGADEAPGILGSDGSKLQ